MIGHGEFQKEACICGIKDKGEKHDRMENIRAKNLPNGRTLVTTILS